LKISVVIPDAAQAAIRNRNTKKISVAGFRVRTFVAPRNDGWRLFQQPARAFPILIESEAGLYVFI
jgi:hypothetical protein